MSRITVTTTVAIPPFVVVGRRDLGGVLVKLSDVCVYLDQVADTFDRAHAVTDVSRSLRAISSGMRAGDVAT